MENEPKEVTCESCQYLRNCTWCVRYALVVTPIAKRYCVGYKELHKQRKEH